MFRDVPRRLHHRAVHRELLQGEEGAGAAEAKAIGEARVDEPGWVRQPRRRRGGRW